VDELETDPSLGSNGADLFSPDLPYQVGGASLLSGYLKTINRLLKQRGFPPIAIDDIANGPAQLKALVDLCHLYGIAVVFDVVYNHAGGFDGDDRSLFFWDRAKNGDLNQSLYVATGVSHEVRTNDAGAYAFPSLNVGDSRYVLHHSGHHPDCRGDPESAFASHRSAA
jgi:hypothetical protein